MKTYVPLCTFTIQKIKVYYLITIYNKTSRTLQCLTGVSFFPFNQSTLFVGVFVVMPK